MEISHSHFASTAKQQWQKTQHQLLESKKPFGLNIAPLKQTPTEEKKIIEVAMKFAFQIDSIILNLYSGPFFMINSVKS